MKNGVLCSLTFLAALQAQPIPVSVRVVPEGITVWGERSSQRFVVVAQNREGMERDVTSTARLSLSDPEKGEIDKSGKFTAKADGSVKLTA